MCAPLDLFVLTADADQKAAVEVLLDRRRESLGIQRCTFEVRKHPQRDPGCVGRGVDLLAPLRTQVQHAIMILDHEGCGREHTSAPELERELDSRLDQAGWEGRARAIVIAPETEIWLWSGSPHVETTFGWSSDRGDMRAWLTARGLLAADTMKPDRPKEAMLAVLQETRVKPSAANFAAIAEAVSVERCQDRSFLRLRATLRRWFPASGQHSP